MRPENWIKWDLASREDPATRFFLSKFKDRARAYGFFLWIVEKLYVANDNTLGLEDPIFLEGFADEIGWQPGEVAQAIAWLIQAKLFFAEGDKFGSKRVTRAVQERRALSDRRAEAGRKGGTNSVSSKQLLSKKKQSQADQIRSDQIRSNNNTPHTPLSGGEGAHKRKCRGPDPEQSEGEAKVWNGLKYIRTTQAEYAKLVKLYGHELIRQEAPNADEWIAKADTPSARKYRRPDANHYLFLRVTWLAGKRLKRDYGFRGPESQPEPKITKQGYSIVELAIPKASR